MSLDLVSPSLGCTMGQDPQTSATKIHFQCVCELINGMLATFLLIAPSQTIHHSLRVFTL